MPYLGHDRFFEQWIICCTSKTGISRTVYSLPFTVFQQFGPTQNQHFEPTGKEIKYDLRWICWMQLDLIHRRDDLTRWIVEEFFQVPNLKIGYANVLDLARVQQLLHFLPASVSQLSILREIVPATHHVFTKSQSGKCFEGSLGSVEQGKCTRYRSMYPIPRSLRDLSKPSRTL